MLIARAPEEPLPSGLFWRLGQFPPDGRDPATDRSFIWHIVAIGMFYEPFLHFRDELAL
jgi:hypothetical protein